MSAFMAAFFFLFFILMSTAPSASLSPAAAEDVLGAYTVVNHLQCQRLCWYQQQCARYSYLKNAVGATSNRDISEVNCVIHSQKTAAALSGFWVSGSASSGRRSVRFLSFLTAEVSEAESNITLW